MKRIIALLPIALILIFGSCSSKKVEVQEPKVAYLAAYMTGDDEKNMYYALARDGFRFCVMNEGKPIVSASFDDRLVRDPMILKDKNNVFHMVATVSWKNQPFTVWDSKDLVTWENERLVNVAPEGATKTWAPEFAYDEENDIYFVHWTAELNDNWETASIYYATTKDFINFSEPRILFSDEEGILDANILKVDGIYHLIYRKNGVWMATSSHAQGPYTNPRQLSPENVEGPFSFPLNDGSGYGLVWDYFGRSLGFGLWTSPDFKNWIRMTNTEHPYYNDQVEFPAGIRHGSIIGLTQKELDGLLHSLH